MIEYMWNERRWTNGLNKGGGRRVGKEEGSGWLNKTKDSWKAVWKNTSSTQIQNTMSREKHNYSAWAGMVIPKSRV